MVTRYSGGFTPAQRAFVGGLINPSISELNNIAAEILGEDESQARDPKSQSARYAQLVRLVLVQSKVKAGDMQALQTMLPAGYDTLPEDLFGRTGLAKSEETKASYHRIVDALIARISAIQTATAITR
jgi:hypothetical protein